LENISLNRTSTYIHAHRCGHTVRQATWPDSAFGGCLGHGLECLGFVGCWIGLAVVSVMTHEQERILVSFGVDLLLLVQETAVLGARVSACRFGWVL
jgi:hypothetical protein